MSRFLLTKVVLLHCSAAVLLLGIAAVPATAGPATLRFVESANGKIVVEVAGLDEAVVARLAQLGWSPEVWSQLLAVRVQTEHDSNLPVMLGSYRAEADRVQFEPRFRLEPGVRYRATFDPSRLPGAPTGPVLTADYYKAKPPTLATTVVQQVYPTSNRLPENLLKFYLHFSAPMSRGEAYRHIHLLDAAGKVVAGAFLELDEELWDPTQQRFTLLFDPSRVKRGLQPHKEVGRALRAGHTYQLVVDRAWLDAKGNPLKQTHRKTFQVLAPDEEPIDPKAWKLNLPPAGSKQALTVRFPKPLDHALLEHMLWVLDDGGKAVRGTVAIGDEETQWQFTPSVPWKAGAYRLRVETALEDLAGNMVDRPFEVDVFRPIQRRIQAETVLLPFHIGERR